MRRKGSRYQKTQAFTEGSGFAGYRPRQLSDAPGIVEHSPTETDRLDTLSHHYFQDNRRGWRILDANNEVLYGFELIDNDDNTEAILIPPSLESTS